MNWILVESRALRFSSFAAFYFSQGLPIGLIGIALPAWLVQQGASVGSLPGHSGVLAPGGRPLPAGAPALWARPGVTLQQYI